jgi:hypothetical protein
MCELKHWRALLMEAKRAHKEDGQVRSAGRYDGLRQAVQILDREAEKTPRKATARPTGGFARN